MLALSARTHTPNPSHPHGASHTCAANAHIQTQAQLGQNTRKLESAARVLMGLHDRPNQVMALDLPRRWPTCDLLVKGRRSDFQNLTGHRDEKPRSGWLSGPDLIIALGECSPGRNTYSHMRGSLPPSPDCGDKGR